MEVELLKVSKHYEYNWILRDLDFCIREGQRTGIRGPNGSGKSTLLRLVSGYLSPSSGKIVHKAEGRVLPRDTVFSQVTFAAPYIDLIEEFTVLEMLNFQHRLRPFRDTRQPDDILQWTYLEGSRHKPVKVLSSGMKQRLKLALAICAESRLVLLDEPGSNLDAQGLDWYRQTLEKYTAGSTVVIASNAEEDFHGLSAELTAPEWQRSLVKSTDRKGIGHA